jgi:sugar phosphate isomerase/epimerase
MTPFSVPVKQWVRHIHIKDSPSPSSKQAAVNYTLPGQGNFPIHPLLKQLRKDHFNGFISLEWEKQWHPDLPELTTALVACRENNWW